MPAAMTSRLRRNSTDHQEGSDYLHRPSPRRSQRPSHEGIDSAESSMGSPPAKKDGLVVRTRPSPKRGLHESFDTPAAPAPPLRRQPYPVDACAEASGGKHGRSSPKDCFFRSPPPKLSSLGDRAERQAQRDQQAASVEFSALCKYQSLSSCNFAQFQAITSSNVGYMGRRDSPSEINSDPPEVGAGARAAPGAPERKAKALPAVAVDLYALKRPDGGPLVNTFRKMAASNPGSSSSEGLGAVSSGGPAGALHKGGVIERARGRLGYAQRSHSSQQSLSRFSLKSSLSNSASDFTRGIVETPPCVGSAFEQHETLVQCPAPKRARSVASRAARSASTGVESVTTTKSGLLG